MADDPSQPRPRETGDTPPRMPRWVKVSGIVVIVLVLLVVVLQLTGVIGDGHGPGRHGPGRHRLAYRP